MDLVEVRSLYRETDKYADQTITVGGWVRNNRDSKTLKTVENGLDVIWKQLKSTRNFNGEFLINRGNSGLA